jgi:hypothetical protein
MEMHAIGSEFSPVADCFINGAEASADKFLKRLDTLLFHLLVP